MVQPRDSPLAGTVSRFLGALALLCALVAAGVLLFPNPLADAFFAGWVAISVGLALVGAFGARTNRTPIVWAAALLLSGLAIVGMWSIGLFIAPAALALLGAALAAQLTGPRPAVRDAIQAAPPTEREILQKTVAGMAFVVGGGTLAYLGAIERELFSACARETVACAIGSVQSGAVGMTVVGLVAAGIGGWLLWKQVYVTRVLATRV